jgi:hypothetical protein
VAGERGIAFAGDAQAHAVFDAAGDVDGDGLALFDGAVARAGGAGAAAGDGEARAAAGRAGCGHMETTHAGDALAGATAGLAFCALCTLLEAGAGTCAAFYERVDVDFLLHASRGVEEGDVGLHFDVVAHEDFLLERVSSSAAAPSLLSSEGAEQVFEVYVLESALEPSCTLCATKSTEATKASSCEWITSSWPAGACSWVEAAIRVER